MKHLVLAVVALVLAPFVAVVTWHELGAVVMELRVWLEAVMAVVVILALVRTLIGPFARRGTWL